MVFRKKKKVSCRNKKLEEVKSKIQHTLDDKKQEKNLILKQIIESDESISSTNVTSISQLDTKFILKVNDKLISKSENSTRSCDNITSEEIYDSRIECDEKLNSEMYTKVNNSLIGKIRVKTPAELGSTVIFIDKSEDLSGILLPTTDVSFQNYFSDLIINTDDADKTENSISVEKLNIQLISKLYKKFFTLENQTKIKKVAELLQNLNENIKRKIDRLVEIKKDNKSTEAEKLMLRHQAHGQFNRVRESNEAALKEQFDIFGKIFDDENFQILFQLLFLGILKMFIVSVSNKKGTLFKTIVNLLLQSLSNSGYKDERIFNLLKSKSFRDECIAIVQFIEKFKETKFFGMLFLSESDKINMLKRINGNHNNELLEIDSENNSCSTKNNTISTDLSVNTSNLPIVSCGSNLLLQPHDKLQNISLSIEQNSMSDTLNSTLLQNINKKLKCTDSITDNIKDVQLCKQSAVIETNHIPFNNNLQFCQNVILNKLNYTGVKFMPNVKISQKASLNMNFSTNTLVLSGTQIPQNTLIIDTQQRQVHTNSVPSVNNVCVSNSAIAHTNMNSSKNLSSVHTPNNSNNIPIMNYTQFQQNNSNCNITNGNESQVPLNSIAAIVETGSNTNLFERKTYGPAKGSNPKIVHQHSESASKTNEQLVNYKQSNNSHQYVTGIKKGSRLLINNSQINICKIHSNKSVDGNINIDNLPHFRVTSKNNENIQPDSILTTKLNKNHENMKTKNCNSTNYVTTNSNNHTNLRSLLSNSTSSVNQNMSTEYITMNRNASDRESNLVLPQTNAIFTVTSDNGNSMIKVNDSLLNSSCMNNYSNCWDKSSVSFIFYQLSLIIFSFCRRF